MVLASFHYGLRGSLVMSVLSLGLLIGLFQYAGQSYLQVALVLLDLLTASASPLEAQRLAFQLADLRASDPNITFHQALFGLASLIATTCLLGSAIDRLADLSWTDGLTQVANRRRFDVALDEEWRRARRQQAPLSLLMVDVDQFKGFNDVYGHRAGDECLRRVAGALAETVNRAGDLVARYGGEEFAVLLPSTAAPAVATIAESMRARVEGLQIPYPGSQRLTVSVGVAWCVPAAEGSPADLVAAADQALYRAKEQGRNRTALAT
jgi:diguanylate cyclase (GGDEF)-like protein